MILLAELLFRSPQLLWSGAALLAATSGLALWLYAPQLSIVRWSAWSLPLLRVVTLAALAISLLRPVATRPRLATERPDVLVLVDQSASMTIPVEAGRAPAQLVALADGAGLLAAPSARADMTGGLRPLITEMVIAAESVSRARSEADYARLSGRGIEASRRRFDEAVARLKNSITTFARSSTTIANAEDLPQRVEELGRLPMPPDDRALRTLRARLDAIARTLVIVQSKSDAALYFSDERVRSTCQQIDRMSRLELVNQTLGTTPLASVITARRTMPSSDSSDLLSALRTLIDQAKTKPPDAIVLFSDGRQLPRARESEADFSDAHIPIFTVAAAGTGAAASRDQPARDISIASMSAPDAIFVGQTATVQATIRGYGAKGTTIAVHLRGALEQSQQITFGESAEATVAFPITVSEPGPIEMVLQSDALPNEATLDNNRASRWINVLPQRLSVTLASGTAGRDYEHLLDLLTATPWIALTHTTLAGDADIFPLAPQQILDQDLLILSDVRIWSLTDAQWEAVDELVNQRGGGIILQISDEQILREYERYPRLARLLPYDPVTSPNYRTASAATTLIPATTGGGASFLADWRQPAPTLRFCPLLSLKPNARAILVERNSPSTTAIAESSAGIGRAIFIGTDETWRWEDSSTFWHNLVRHAAPQPYAVQTSNYFLDADAIAVEPGGKLHVRVKVLRDDGTPARAASQELQVLRDGQIIKTVQLYTSTITGPGRYDGTLSADFTDEGDCTLQINTGDDLTEPPRLSIRVQRSSEAELADLSADPRLLRRIADSSGGEFLSMDQLTTLPARLDNARQRTTSVREVTLWDSPYLYIFVVACLTLEWSLRKRMGLA